LDAFERLTSKRLLTAAEERSLFAQPPQSATPATTTTATSAVVAAASSSGALRFSPQLEWLRLVWLNRVDVEQIDAFELQQQAMRSGDAALVSAKAVGSALARAGSEGASTTDLTARSSAGQLSLAPSSSLLHRYRQLSVDYSLGSNLDLLSSVIAHRYAQGEYESCLDLCEQVQAQDPFLLSIMPTFLACLVHMGNKSRLFFVAHRLVAAYPRRAVSWHAVGCYYLLLGALEVARRFFHKATRLDALCPYAWVGFGHTFSYQDESEQALLSYRTAHRLFEGAHVPLLCMGQEYLRTNHLVLARHFLTRAADANPDDPLPRHELGVLAYKSADLPLAVEHFVAALARVKQQALHHWEPTMFNLGHAYRKMGSAKSQCVLARTAKQA
jgi:tetratricopeptide (TPR) repeat protein